MCGYKLADWMNKWENGESLTNKELSVLIDGIRVFIHFLIRTGQRQLSTYYIIKLNSMNAAMEARRRHKKNKYYYGFL